MDKRCGVPALVVFLGLLGAVPAQADDFAIDGMHSGVTFKISHLGLSWVYGRFNEFSGEFTLDPDAAKCSFGLTIKTESVDTANAKRDEHLRAPDFFNAKQFPAITFKSTAVRAIKDGFEVTGDLTLHGETKPVKFNLVGGRTAEFPKGVRRTGFSTELIVKRSEFGMSKFTEMLGDDVHVAISFEGTKK
jgi:polyisoprenoid-binding protein YceI